MLVDNLIGFMQGRLTEKGGFYPQSFPEENWIQEFYLAENLGFDCIEWMFNKRQWNKNPVILEKELPNIITICQNTNMKITGICANYFMEDSIYNLDAKAHNCLVLNKLLLNAQTIGCKNIIIPLFAESALQINNTTIYEIVDNLIENDVFILFEADAQLIILKEWLSGFKRKNIGICYDIGNAAGLGYDSVKELLRYGDIVKNVHIKDKKMGGNTVMLGDGDACFKECFTALQQSSYIGSYILESYYFEAIKDTCQNLNYIKEILK
ncbi:MAG: sugar phosphate isomerase/epimerase [Eubacterium sp.]|nr:sugar phosphate isomerase/epimerase [Eubacterium sp.]